MPKRDEVTGYWRTLHNQELRALYLSRIKEDEMSGTCGMCGKQEIGIQGCGGET